MQFAILRPSSFSDTMLAIVEKGQVFQGSQEVEHLVSNSFVLLLIRHLLLVAMHLLLLAIRNKARSALRQYRFHFGVRRPTKKEKGRLTVMRGRKTAALGHTGECFWQGIRLFLHQNDQGGGKKELHHVFVELPGALYQVLGGRCSRDGTNWPRRSF